MIKIKNFLALLLVTVFIVSSCSIEKRVHRPGYHVAWKKSQSNHENGDNQKLAVENTKQSMQKGSVIETPLKTKKVIVETLAFKKSTASSSKHDKQYKESATTTEEKVHILNKGVRTDEAMESPSNSEVQTSSETKSNSGGWSDAMFILLVILCLIIPPLAVYLITEDLLKTLIALILTLLFVLPGVIYAFYLLFTEY